MTFLKKVVSQQIIKLLLHFVVFPIYLLIDLFTHLSTCPYIYIHICIFIIVQSNLFVYLFVYCLFIHIKYQIYTMHNARSMTIDVMYLNCRAAISYQLWSHLRRLDLVLLLYYCLCLLRMFVCLSALPCHRSGIEVTILGMWPSFAISTPYTIPHICVSCVYVCASVRFSTYVLSVSMYNLYQFKSRTKAVTTPWSLQRSSITGGVLVVSNAFRPYIRVPQTGLPPKPQGKPCSKRGWMTYFLPLSGSFTFNYCGC